MLTADGRKCRRISNYVGGRWFREGFAGRRLRYICNWLVHDIDNLREDDAAPWARMCS